MNDRQYQMTSAKPPLNLHSKYDDQPQTNPKISTGINKNLQIQLPTITNHYWQGGKKAKTGQRQGKLSRSTIGPP